MLKFSLSHFALAGKKAKVMVAGNPISVTNEATATTDNQKYTIVNTSRHIMSLGVTPIVKEDSIQTTENYTLNRLYGTVTFETIDVVRGVITLDYDFVPTTLVTEAHEFSLTQNAELADVTPFLSEWSVKQPQIKSAEGSISDFEVEDSYFEDKLISGDPVVIELYPNELQLPIRLFVILNSTELQKQVNSPQDRTVGFESTDKMGQ